MLNVIKSTSHSVHLSKAQCQCQCRMCGHMLEYMYYSLIFELDFIEDKIQSFLLST